MEKQIIRAAMIGSGGYAFELIKRILSIPDQYKLVAVSSRNIKDCPGITACLNFNIDIYHDSNTMINSIKNKIDVVFIPTPIHTHKLLAEQCINAGLDVFLEKPPVATIQELDELNSIANKSNKCIAVMFQSLYSEVIRKLKQRIVDCEFGKIYSIRGMAAFPRLDSYFTRNDWAGKIMVDGRWVLDGTINNPLAHLLSNQLYLAGEKLENMANPVEVCAELYHGHVIESEDTASLRVKTQNGVEILFNASLCPNRIIEPLITIFCEKAHIEIKNYNTASVVFNDGLSETLADPSDQISYMLCKLHKSYINKENFDCTLNTCRPFTVCVNAAFESCGRINDIEDFYITREKCEDSIKTIINGIDEAIITANRRGSLISEINVKWARSSRAIYTENYSSFKYLI